MIHSRAAALRVNFHIFVCWTRNSGVSFPQVIDSLSDSDEDDLPSLASRLQGGSSSRARPTEVAHPTRVDSSSSSRQHDIEESTSPGSEHFWDLISWLVILIIDNGVPMGREKSGTMKTRIQQEPCCRTDSSLFIIQTR